MRKKSLRKNLSELSKKSNGVEKVYLGIPSNRKRISKKESRKLIDKGYMEILGTNNDVYLIKGESK